METTFTDMNSSIHSCVLTAPEVSDTAANSCCNSGATIAISDQASSFVTTLLPPQGFSLVNVDLGQLQGPQAQNEQDDDDLEELDDGVNLVVKATYWCCKDCNIKQKFGSGESIEEHLRNKHRINNKTEDTADQVVVETSLITQDKNESLAKMTASDMIASVYTIPSNSMTDQDQAIDTLIVFEDDTTLQVITNTKPSEDKCVYSGPSETLGNKTKGVSQDSARWAANLGVGTSSPSACVKPTHTAALPQMKPIPVIPALQSASYTMFESSPNPGLKPDNGTSGQIPVGHGLVDQRTRSPLDLQGLETDPDERKMQVVTKSPQRKNNKSEPAPEISAESEITTSHVGTRSNTHIHQEAIASTPSIEVHDCSVQLKRLTSEDVLQLTNGQRCLSKKSMEVRQSSKTKTTKGQASQPTDVPRTVVVGSKRANESPGPLQLSKKARHRFRTDTLSVAGGSETHTLNSKDKSHSSSGRRIRKPARFLTGTESEENEKHTRTESSKGEVSTVSSQNDKKNFHTSNLLYRKHNIDPAVGQPQQKKQPSGDANDNSNALPVRKKLREDKYSCQDCGRKFKFENKLKKHVALYSGQTMQQCSMCEVKLHNQDLLNVHLYYIHKTQESTSCSACDKILGSKRNLLHHLLTHNNSKGQTVANLIKDSCAIHQCEFCDEAIVEGEGRVEKHYLTHQKTHFHSCQRCGKKFTRKRELYNHLKMHGIPKEVVLQLGDQGQTEQENTDSKDQYVVLHDGDRCEAESEQDKTDGDNKSSLLITKKEVLAKVEDTELGLGGQFVYLQSSDQRQTQEQGTCSKEQDGSFDILGITQNLTGKHEIQGDELKPVEKIIAQSVEQIMKYEENALLSSNIPITITFIPTEIEETGTEHVLSVSDGPPARPSFYCQLCSKHFTTKKQLYQHLKSHGTARIADDEDGSQTLGEDVPVYQPLDLSEGVPFGVPCSLVKLECLEGVEDYLMKSFTTTPEGLVVPRQMHYTCALCEREFESENKGRRHVNRFGKQQTIVQCNLCPRKFHNLDLFNVHYVYMHQPEGAATCMTCSTEFNNKGDFLTHLGNDPVAHPLSQKLGLKTFLQDACGTVTCLVCQKSMWNYPMNIANHTKLHKSFHCPICQQGFPYKYALLIHLQVHTNSKNLNLVSELSQRELEQGEHAEQVDKIHSIILVVESPDFVENNEKFSCSLCEGEVWCQRKNIHRHLDLHARRVLHTIREGRYFCPECGEDMVITDQSILDHLSSHGHSVLPFKCVFCTLVFATFEEYKDHEVKKHWLNIYFEKSMCEVCGKELANRQELRKHVQLHEEKQGLFPCPRCTQTFRFDSKLQKHMAKHDNGRDSFACQFCGKLYMTKISLDRHEQVDHVGKKDFKHKCKLCDAQFINATHLRDHVTNKHTGGASYTCKQCGAGFKHLSTYVRHKRVEHGGDTPYVCQECGEKFPVKKELQRHMIIHTGVNPFQCTVCLKSFSLERTMQEHFDFVHRGIVKFVCDNCGSKFPRKRNLTRHMTTCRMTTVFLE